MTDSINREKLKDFLFYDLSDDERFALEERFFADNDLFYELMELENELVDRYINDDLSAADRTKFERSLANFPDRQEKILNAKALQAFIAQETSTVLKIKSIEKTPTFWEQVVAFFTFKKPAMQYLTAALLLILTAGMGFLIYDRIRLNNEMAEIKNRQQERLIEIEQREKELQEKLRQIEERKENLKNQNVPNENSNTTVENKNTELEEIKKEKQKTEQEQKRLKNEAEKLKKDKTIPPARKKELPQPPKPIIASITLLPLSGSKGGGDEIKQIDKNATTIAATLQIPEDIKSESFTVLLNSTEILKNAKPKNNAITVRINTKNLTPGKDNLITLRGNDGRQKQYGFRVQQ